MDVSEKHPWVILDREDLFCLRCGRREGPLFPLNLGEKRLAAFKATCEAFTEEHSCCVETDASPSRRKWTRPEDWIMGHDTGTSSETIFSVMTGKNVRSHGDPLDPDDFGRCHRLLKLFPEWRKRMPEVAAKFPNTSWPALVREWDRLTTLYEQEVPNHRGSAPKLYDAMKKCRGDR